MKIDDEVLDRTLEALWYFLENMGRSKSFAAAAEAECELWEQEHDPKVHDSFTVRATHTGMNHPRSWEVIEWKKGVEIRHFEVDAGKVTSRILSEEKDLRKVLFEFALDTMSFERPRELKDNSKV